MENELRVKEGNRNQRMLVKEIGINYKNKRREELELVLIDDTKQVSLELSEETIKRLRQVLNYTD